MYIHMYIYIHIFGNSGGGANQTEVGRGPAVERTAQAAVLQPPHDRAGQHLRVQFSGSLEFKNSVFKNSIQFNWSPEFNASPQRHDSVPRSQTQNIARPRVIPPSGTCQTARARFRPWLSGRSHQSLSRCSLFARKRLDTLRRLSRRMLWRKPSKALLTQESCIRLKPQPSTLDKLSNLYWSLWVKIVLTRVDLLGQS